MGAICFLLILQFYNNKLAYAFALPVLILGLFYAILNGISLRAVASFPPVAIIGGMCYSIYLLHYPVIAMAGPFLRNIPNPVLTACILCMVILAISTTFFCFIERPTMNPGWPKTLALRVKNRLTQKPANPKQDRLRENELPVQIKN
jgi:peptidoglycan/LPS O-acetylase OafA/YrhL